MVFDINSNTMRAVYDFGGQSLHYAYDLYGDVVFSGDPVTIKVMTYNVGQWYEGRGSNVPADEDAVYYALQNGMIADNLPDILCIEEYWKIFSQTGRTALSMLQQYFPYIHEQGGDSGYFGRCVCSKYPILGYVVNTYSNEPQRYYDNCTVLVNGRRLSVVVTHLGLTPEDREPQIAELVAYLSGLRAFVCCGDYNTPYSWHSTPIPETLAELDPFSDAGLKLSNCGDIGFYVTSCGDTIDQETGEVPDGVWRAWIDNISTSDNLTPTSAYVDRSKIDALLAGTITHIDHMPFIAEIEM